MCKVCIYDPIPGQGTWRQQVGDCTSYECPLYAVRPLPSGSDDTKVDEAANVDSDPLDEALEHHKRVVKAHKTLLCRDC